jgi:Domain of unknown function (DUF397)
MLPRNNVPEVREVADPEDVVWRKSTFSDNNGCVEVGFVNRHVALRDSENPAMTTLTCLFSMLEMLE